MKLLWTTSLFLSSYPDITTGAALGLRPVTTPAGDYIDRPRSSNVTPIANDSPHCTRSAKWVEPPYLPERCVDALSSLKHEYVRRLGSIKFEFIAPGAIPTYAPLIPVTTPKKWEIGGCSIVINMLEYYLPGELPGSGLDPYSATDVTSFRDLWEAAQTVLVGCMHEQSALGWTSVGQRENIGVFIWSSGSIMNQQTSGGVSPQNMTLLPPGPNTLVETS